MGYLKNLFSRKADEESAPDTRLAIENVAEGGIFNIRNYGPDMEDIDVKVTRKNMFAQEQFCWYELQGIASNGQQVFLEIDKDDELELDISIDRDLSLSEIGVTLSELTQIDEEEEGRITYQGKVYEYEDSDQAFYYRDCDEGNEREFYYWDFYNDGLGFTITVKAWGRGNVEVALTQSLREDQFEVYALGGDAGGAGTA